MEALRITGGRPLNGEVTAAGAKNAITKMLVASLISPQRCLFHNVPNIGEVENTLYLLKQLGLKSQWDTKTHRLEVQTPSLSSLRVTQKFSGANRIPILLLGAVLGRTQQEVIVPTVGGCKIGKRPVDFHLYALEKLGAHIELIEVDGEKAFRASAPEGLKGTVIELPYPSVGATENALLAAIRAKGKTTIRNAALEPEVVDLVHFLQKLGVRVHFTVDRIIEVRETTRFFDVEHTVLADRIEVASLAMAALSTKGSLFIRGAEHSSLVTFLSYLRDLGAEFTVHTNGIEFSYKRPLQGGIHIDTNIHPGFLTDWGQPFVTLLTQAEGHSIMHETLYENRFGYTKTLQSMGADLTLFTSCLGQTPCRFHGHNFQHSVSVKGATPLYGKQIAIPDLRAGFAYVMAALIAEGESTITNLHYLDRGYEHLDHKLQSLGAQIERVHIDPLLQSPLSEKATSPV